MLYKNKSIKNRCNIDNLKLKKCLINRFKCHYESLNNRTFFVHDLYELFIFLPVIFSSLILLKSSKSYITA